MLVLSLCGTGIFGACSRSAVLSEIKLKRLARGFSVIPLTLELLLPLGYVAIVIRSFFSPSSSLLLAVIALLYCFGAFASVGPALGFLGIFFSIRYRKRVGTGGVGYLVAAGAATALSLLYLAAALIILIPYLV